MRMLFLLHFYFNIFCSTLSNGIESLWILLKMNKTIHYVSRKNKTYSTFTKIFNWEMRRCCKMVGSSAHQIVRFEFFIWLRIETWKTGSVISLAERVNKNQKHRKNYYQALINFLIKIHVKRAAALLSMSMSLSFLFGNLFSILFFRVAIVTQGRKHGGRRG